MRQISFQWARRAEKRKPPEQRRLDAIRALGDELTAALDLADAFAGLIRKQSTGTLSEWLTRGEASPDPDLRRFAEGIRRDEAAVRLGIPAATLKCQLERGRKRLAEALKLDAGQKKALVAVARGREIHPRAR